MGRMQIAAAPKIPNPDPQTVKLGYKKLGTIVITSTDADQTPIDLNVTLLSFTFEASTS
jgi:hypothetical protein